MCKYAVAGSSPGRALSCSAHLGVPPASYGQLPHAHNLLLQRGGPPTAIGRRRPADDSRFAVVDGRWVGEVDGVGEDDGDGDGQEGGRDE